MQSAAKHLARRTTLNVIDYCCTRDASLVSMTKVI
jgi:hypothetical protein